MLRSGSASSRRLRSRWTLRRRLTVAVALLAVATVAVGGWTDWLAWSARAAALTEQGSLVPATASAAAAVSAFSVTENAAGSYVQTRIPAARREFHSESATVTLELGALRRQLLAEPIGRGLLATAAHRYEHWLASVARPAIDAASPSGSGASGKPQHSRATSASGVLSSAAPVWLAMATLEVRVAGLAGASERQLDASITQLFLINAFRVGAVLVLLATVLVLLRRWVNAPVEQLVGDVRFLAAGGIDRPVELHGPPELASVTRDLEEMRRRIRDESDEIRQLRQALGEHSPLHALLHSELEPATSAGPAVAGRQLPAEGVLAGDWYDIWDRGRHQVAAAIVDISGHGPAAGLFALKVKHLLTPPMRSGMPPGEVLDWVARECGRTDEQFATGIVIDLDRRRRVCRYANAGHPSGLLFRDGDIELLEPTGPLMFALPGSWRTVETEVAEGDLIVMTTDGVTEARRPGGTELGTAGIVEAVRHCQRTAPPDAVAEEILALVRQQCVRPLKDDATVVVVRVAPGWP